VMFDKRSFHDIPRCEVTTLACLSDAFKRDA
jgi:hypothetical protein